MNKPKNPNYNKFVLPEGYKDIGWQVGIENEYKKKCHESGHTIKEGQIREIDNSLFLWRCTDVVRICDICKIVDHTDMSD